MKTILVPIDFSKYSENALKVAADIAKKQDCEILALHMLEIADTLLTKAEGNTQRELLFFIQLAEKRFDELLNKEYLKGVRVTPIVKHFKIFNEVNDVVDEHNADLIIMGSHGSSGIKELFVGSNTEKVVRSSNIPVLVVKEEITGPLFDKIVFASNFELENINALKNVQQFASNFNSNLQLVYINTPGDNFKNSQEINNQLQSFLSKTESPVDLSNVKVYNDYSIEKGILNASEELDATLIAIPTHGRKGLAHFFNGSISEDIANHSNLSVLTFKI